MVRRLTPGGTEIAGPWWSVLPAAGVLLGTALAAAVLEGALDPAGGPTLPHRAGRPLWEAARLLRQRRRRIVAADTLLWRLGLAGPLLVALLTETAATEPNWPDQSVPESAATDPDGKSSMTCRSRWRARPS
ncbi:hypothetical protein B0E53_01428 [Micromonospora sp. MH33]|nr:hypothetical protein B0E53_01428 [Micromonospora sp. MH33]